MERKYKQRGYAESDREERPKPVRPREKDGPKSPQMTAFQEVVRCAMCGAQSQVAVGGVTIDSTCGSCKSDLRTCKNCKFFDPGARFQCRTSIVEPVRNKTARTSCPQFTA